MKRLLALPFFMVSIAFAQEAPKEGPPAEPPYTSGENEFGPDAPAVVEAPRPRPLQQASPDEPPVKYIQHPDAKKGLYRIDADGSYHYVPNKHSKKSQASTVRLGSMIPAPKITSADERTNFETMYGSSNPFVLMYDYEWIPFDNFGFLAVQAGFGYFSASGQGRFLNSGTEAREKYTFHALPINLGVIYRLEFLEKQWVAPYVAGGGSYYVLAETRDDGKAPHGVGTPAGYAAGGLMFNLTNINKEAGFHMDAEYGIADLWLTLEARQIQATNKDLDVSGTLLTLGVSADY